MNHIEWRQLQGTHPGARAASAGNSRVDCRRTEPAPYRAQCEVIRPSAGPTLVRTLCIEGLVSNVPSSECHGATPMKERVGLDRQSQLIAARFGGPACPENLVAMHEAIGQSGGRWANMEEAIGRLLVDEDRKTGRKGLIQVRVLYAEGSNAVDGARPMTSAEVARFLRPTHFLVDLQLMTGRRYGWTMANHGAHSEAPCNPELWRSRILEELRRLTSLAKYRQSLLACRDASRLERLHGALRPAVDAALEAFRCAEP